jgi:hypothetical protein
MKVPLSRRQEHRRFLRGIKVSNHRADSEFEIVAAYREFHDRIHSVTMTRTGMRPIVAGVAAK